MTSGRSPPRTSYRACRRRCATLKRLRRHAAEHRSQFSLDVGGVGIPTYRYPARLSSRLNSIPVAFMICRHGGFTESTAFAVGTMRGLVTRNILPVNLT